MAESTEPVRHRFTLALALAGALSCWFAACEPPPLQPTPPASAPTSQVAAVDVAALVASATKSWLAGDLEAAIAELGRAVDEPRALALLARVCDLAGRREEAERAAASALAHGAPGAAVVPRLRTDGSLAEPMAVSSDGAFVATKAGGRKFKGPDTITVWDVVAGSDVFTREADDVVFGVDDGTIVAVMLAQSAGKLSVAEARTGTERWTADVGHSYDVAVDQGGTVTTLAADGGALRQWRLATGEKVGEIATGSNAAFLSLAAGGTAALAGNTVIDLVGTPRTVAKLPPATLATGIIDRRVSPDGQTIAQSERNRTVVLMDREGHERVRLPDAGTYVQFLDDGSLVAAQGRRLTLWDMGGQALGTVEVPEDERPAGLGGRITIGPGGHVVMRRAGSLVVHPVRAPGAPLVATLGTSSDAESLAWSPDGAFLTLGMRSRPDVRWFVSGRAEEVAGTGPRIGWSDDSPAGDEAGAALGAPRLELVLHGARAFVREEGGRVLRFVEAPEDIGPATFGGDRIVALGRSGMLYVWDAQTAEGLGTLAPVGPGVVDLALRPDGRTLALTRKAGGVELWDVSSRSLVLTVAASADHWVALEPAGRVDGTPDAVRFQAGDLTLPGGALWRTHAEPGLAARVLAHPPPPAAETRTAAPRVRAASCVPLGETGFTPVGLSLAGDVLSYCLSTGSGDPPCFRVDLAGRVVTPFAASLDVVAPLPFGVMDPGYAGGDVKVCRGGACQTVPVPPNPDGGATLFALSEDKAYAVFQVFGRDREVQTWDVAAGQPIARFAVRYGGEAQSQGFESLAFWDHDVVAIDTPCGGPCGHGFVYDLRGHALAKLAGEATEFRPVHLYDDVWAFRDGPDGANLVLQGTKTGRVVASRAVGELFEVAASSAPERLALVLAGAEHPGKVIVLDRAAHVVAEISPPFCQP